MADKGIDDAPVQKDGESEEGVSNLPWMEYFGPANSTKLITKRCIPFSIYIGLYYAI